MRKIPFGRLFARRLLSNCIFATCIENPYPSITEDTDSEGKYTVVKPMISWNRSNWDEVQNEFMDLRGLAVRKDTKNVLNFNIDDAGVERLSNPNDLDKKLDSEKMFNRNLQRLQKRFQIQAAIAHIREKMEKAVTNKSEPTINKDDTDEILYVATLLINC